MNRNGQCKLSGEVTEARRSTSLEDRLKAFYDLRAGEEPENDSESWLRFRKALAAADISPGERVLDVGAKQGGLAACADNLGLAIDYVGLELSEENVRSAADKELDVRLADASQSLPVENDDFDCVFCLELLEHLPSPLGLLMEIARALVPDGRAVLSVPNPYSWVEIYRELFRRPDPEGHISEFTTPVFENLLALAGMRLDRRLGTSLRIPKTMRLIPTNSVLARSRIFVVRPAQRVVFAGREF